MPCIHIQGNPAYKKALEIVQIPERVLQFRVLWEDDKGQAQVNRGYRVQVSPTSTDRSIYRSFNSSRSTTLLSVHTKVVSVCTPPSTCLSSNSSALNKPSRMLSPDSAWVVERVRIPHLIKNPFIDFSSVSTSENQVEAISIPKANQTQKSDASATPS